MDEPKTKVISVRLPTELIQQLDAHAVESGRARNAIIEEAVCESIDVPYTERLPGNPWTQSTPDRRTK